MELIKEIPWFLHWWKNGELEEKLRSGLIDWLSEEKLRSRLIDWLIDWVQENYDNVLLIDWLSECRKITITFHWLIDWLIDWVSEKTPDCTNEWDQAKPAYPVRFVFAHHRQARVQYFLQLHIHVIQRGLQIFRDLRTQHQRFRFGPQKVHRIIPQIPDGIQQATGDEFHTGLHKWKTSSSFCNFLRRKKRKKRREKKGELTHHRFAILHRRKRSEREKRIRLCSDYHKTNKKSDEKKSYHVHETSVRTEMIERFGRFRHDMGYFRLDFRKG